MTPRSSWTRLSYQLDPKGNKPKGTIRPSPHWLINFSEIWPSKLLLTLSSRLWSQRWARPRTLRSTSRSSGRVMRPKKHSSFISDHHREWAISFYYYLSFRVLYHSFTHEFYYMRFIIYVLSVLDIFTKLPSENQTKFFHNFQISYFVYFVSQRTPTSTSSLLWNFDTYSF